MNSTERHPDPVVRRLGPADLEVAGQTLRLMTSVFEEPADELSARYVDTLLARTDFWLIAALQDGVPIGGLTAHALPMTRNESRELFIYDLAVDAAHQRRGVGRALVHTACALAASEGIRVSFVPADDEDDHAIAFYRAIGGDGAPVTIFTFTAD